MLTKRTKMAAAVLAAAFGAPSAVFAASVNVDLDTSTAGVQATRDVTPPATFGSTINFVGDATVTNVSGRLDYNTALLDATVTAASGAVCAVNEVAGQIAFTTTSGSGAALPSQTVCNVTFTVPGTVTPPQMIALTFSNMTFAGSAGGDTTQGGTINVVAAPVMQAPTLTFTPPAPGPVALSTAGTGSIAVSAGTGTAGTTTSLACTPSAGFGATVTGSPFAPSSSGTVNLTCTPGAAVQNGTVSCDPTQSAGTDQAAQVFNVSCPVAPPLPPEFDAPLSLALVGGPGTPQSGTIVVRNIGTGPLTITCTPPTGGFTLTQAPAPTVAAGGSTNIGLACTTPGAAGASTTGTLTCTTNDTSEGTVVFALSCTSQILSVPALGNTAKGMLIALLAGLGLLGFAMRRRLV